MGWLFALTNCVSSSPAQSTGKARGCSTKYKPVRLNPRPFFFFRKFLCSSGISCHPPPFRNQPEGQTAPHTRRAKPSPCHCTYPRGTPRAELPPWQEFGSPFPGWGRGSYQHSAGLIVWLREIRAHCLRHNHRELHLKVVRLSPYVRWVKREREPNAREIPLWRPTLFWHSSHHHRVCQVFFRQDELCGGRGTGHNRIRKKASVLVTV